MVLFWESVFSHWNCFLLSIVGMVRIDKPIETCRDWANFCAMGAEITQKIGQLHDDDIWLQLPEFISVLLCYLNLSIPLRIKEQ